MSRVLLKHFPSILQNKGHISDSGVYIRFIEDYIRKHTTDDFRRRQVRIGSPTGELCAEIGDVLGKGVFGCVYVVRSVSGPSALRTDWPHLFDGDAFTREMVIKVPNQVSDDDRAAAERVNLVFRESLCREYEETLAIARQFIELKLDPIDAAAICFFGYVDTLPVLLKKRLQGLDIGQIARTGSSLSREQLERLRADIFDKADSLRKIKGTAIDIRPENLLWNTERGRWQMLELTSISPGMDFCANGFEHYSETIGNAIRRIAGHKTV